MIPRRRILLSVLWVAAVLPALAGSAHYPITQVQIAAAISSGGMQVSPDQISLLSHVVARVAQPALKLKSIQPEANNGMVARIECADPSQCVPFMVALHVSNGVLSAAAQEPDPGQSNTLLVHAGATAVLLLDGAHVHICIPVICLGNGTLGQTIRATSPDRHQFYTVQVAGERILRGRL